MKQYIIIGLIFLAVGVAGFFYGRSTIKESIITLPVDINVDSLKNEWLAGKVDVIDLDSLKGKNESLNEAIAELKRRMRIPAKPETVTVPGKAPEVKIPSWVIDSSFKVDVNGRIVEGGDTSNVSTATKLKLKGRWLGGGLNGLLVEELKLDPFRIPYKAKQIVKEPVDMMSMFSIDLIAGSNASQNNQGIGLILNIERFGIGAMMNNHGTPFYFGKIRLIPK